MRPSSRASLLCLAVLASGGCSNDGGGTPVSGALGDLSRAICQGLFECA